MITVETNERVLVHVVEGDTPIKRVQAEEAAQKHVRLYYRAGTTLIGKTFEPYMDQGRKVWPIQVVIVDRIPVEG